MNDVTVYLLEFLNAGPFNAGSMDGSGMRRFRR